MSAFDSVLGKRTTEERPTGFSQNESQKSQIEFEEVSSDLQNPFTSENDNTEFEEDETIDDEPLDAFTEEEPLQGFGSQLSEEAVEDLSSFHIDETTDFPTFTDITTTIPNAIITMTRYMGDVSRMLATVSQSIMRISENTVQNINEKITLFKKKRLLTQASNETQKAINVLNSISDKSLQISTDKVLRLVKIELLIEKILNVVSIESIHDIRLMLVIPVLELLTQHSTYFGFNDPPTALSVFNAYSEFALHQDVRDDFLQVYDRNIALIHMTRELASLYDELFSTTLQITTNRSLTINGHIRIIKSLLVNRESNKIAEIPGFKPGDKTAILSAVDYSGILGKHIRHAAQVNAEFATLRTPPNANVQAPPAVGIPHGYLNRADTIAADSGLATFGPPISIVMPDENMEEDVSTQNTNISELKEAISGENEEIDLTKNIDLESRFMVLVAEQINSGFELSDNVKARLEQYRNAREAGANPTEKTVKMASIATERMTISNNLLQLVLNLHTELVSGVFSNMQPKEKKQIWDRELHRIFLQWYKEHSRLEEARSALDANTKAPRGGKKSYKHKKHLNKSTRKHKKRYTRKLHKKHKRVHTKKH
jgi:hypothetical protein